MALTDYAAYKAAQPYAKLALGKLALTTISGVMYSRWQSAPFNGAAPTAAVVPNPSLQGGLLYTPTGIATWIKSAQMGRTAGGCSTICDRLSHQGGLSGTVITAQTTNLPTAALTRFTTGVGVMIALEIYTAIGTTVTTVTVSYTNSAGVAGRTSIAQTFGGTNNREVARFIILPLQSGDVGARSVESVTLLASTVTVGNFGVTLIKPIMAIASFPVNANANFDVVRDMGCMFEPIPADPHLFVIYNAASTSTFLTTGMIDLIKQV